MTLVSNFSDDGREVKVKARKVVKVYRKDTGASLVFSITKSPERDLHSHIQEETGQRRSFLCSSFHPL